MVYSLRKVIWFVPDFTVGKYHDRLKALHERIQADGAFVAFSRRFLIEARKPERGTGSVIQNPGDIPCSGSGGAAG